MSKTADAGAAFKEAYASLNAAQKKAVDTIEGPVMVIAGPGTGKTQILTLRIANILLQTDTQPENILALTFTESGAKAMRNRLRHYIGSAAYRVPIYTFHGFAGQLIAQYPDAFTRIIGGRPASDIDKITIIQASIDSSGVKLLRPLGNPAYYVTPIIRELANLKQEYITPDRLAEIITRQEAELSATPRLHEKGAHKGKVRGEYSKLEKEIEKNRELLIVYKHYEAAMRERQLYDFEDMLIEAVLALKHNEDMLRDMQETYQYVLADEHQDVNGTQNTLLELLVSYHDRPNIFAVGDEKQAIYRFQGASLENFLYFEERFAGTVTIALTDNYRSGQPILDVAHSLVAVEDGPLKELRVPLSAAAVDGATIEQWEFVDQVLEDTWVTQTVQSELEQGTDPEEIAVIVRTNREVEQITEALRKAGMAVNPSADGDILAHPITTALIDLIEAVIEPESNERLFALLHAPYWDIALDDLVRLVSARSYDTPLVHLLHDEARLQALGLTTPERVMRLVATLDEARSQSLTSAPHRTLERLLQASGFLDHVLQHDPIEGVRVTRRLYDEIELMVRQGETATLAAVVTNLRQRQAYGLPLTAPYINTGESAVSVMTAHKSKGLEFTAVIMPHLADSTWGGGKRRQNFKIPTTRLVKQADVDALDDERRLLFVGLTRAKERLYLSYSGRGSDGRELLPSRLLEDLDSTLISRCSTESSNFDPVTSLQLVTPTRLPDQALVTQILAERGFSATSLNNYLRSPWDYFYRNVLRIPEVQPVHMQFGTAMHDVLQRITRFHTTEQSFPAEAQVREWLGRALGKLPVTTEEFTRLHEKALSALVLYQEHLAATLPKETKEELSVTVALPTGLAEFPEVTLTGKLDRIDFAADGKALRVVDYKTGKPKSRNEIEGKTKTSDGGYKRQLIFYALLLSLYEQERYQTREGVLSFVEPTTKGEIKEEQFSITREEIDELQQTIINAVKQIVSGSFLATPCDESVSSYCHLAKRWFKED